jgi:tetratricopeptide (TPR) repeat protein
MELLHQQGMTHQALLLCSRTCDRLAQEGLETTEVTKALAVQLQEERHAARRSSVHFPYALASGARVDTHEAIKPVEMSELALSTMPYGVSNAFRTKRPERLSIDIETLHLFGTLTETCLRLSEGSQLTTAERILWSYLPEVETFAQQSSEHQQAAANITSQGYLIAASLVGHRNNLKERKRFSEQAWLYGNLAQDCNLQVAALRQLAVTYDYQKCYRDVLETYQRALPYLNTTSPRLQACIYAALSGAYAHFKKEEETSLYIRLAYEHFPEIVKDEPNILRLVNANYHTVVLWDGLNHLELGQPQTTERIFAQLDVLTRQAHIPERIRVELLNARAEAFTAVGKMDQACTYLEAALLAAIEIGSKRRIQESFTVFQKMRAKWSSEQRVQRLSDLFMQYLIDHAH